MNVIPKLTFLLLLQLSSINAVITKPEDKIAPILNADFTKQKLADFIQEIGAKKGINIILPQKTLKTFDEQNVIYKTLKDFNNNPDQAWESLLILLDMSGYSIFEKGANLWEIIETGKKDEESITRQAIDTYINIAPDDIPFTNQQIRYIYYLKNIILKSESNDALNTIIKQMSTVDAANPIYLPQTNGLILIDRANNISSIINLISNLDNSGFRETVSVIPIFNIPASEIAAILQTIKKAVIIDNTPNPFIRAEPESGALTNFASDTEIFSDNRNNSLIIMGRDTAVNYITEFIKEHFDKPPLSGKSILHYYNLQYLDAKEFAPILQSIVASQLQTSQATGQAVSGPDTFFQGVVIKAEQYTELKPITGSLATQEVTTDKDTNIEVRGIQGQTFGGGNRLIIAALHDDWIQIKDLIKELDQPQPLAVIDIVIADFVLSHQDQLASTIRNPTNPEKLLGGLEFLSSQISPVNSVLGPSPTRLTQDLLAVTGASSLATNVSPGSLLISFNNPSTPGIWAVIQLLKSYNNTSIYSFPFLIVGNNKKGTLSQVLKRRNRGDILPGVNGSFIIPIEDITATFNFSVIPQIADAEHLKLNLAVRIEDFLGQTLNKITRGFSTTTNLKRDDIMVIVGLKRTDERVTVTKTPILGDIPFFGNLFRGEQLNNVQTHIAIFVSPHIIYPRDIKTSAHYIENITQQVFDDMGDDILYNDIDPITRLFFNNFNANEEYLNQYFNATSNLNDDDPDEELSTILPKIKTFKKRLNISRLKDRLAVENNPFAR